MAPLQPAPKSPNLDDLLHVLNAATDKSTLQWKKTAEDDTFRTELGHAMVRISKSSADPRYTLTFLDQQGVLLDEFQPSEEAQLTVFEELYKKARRQALNLEGKLQDIYDRLKNLAGES